MKRGSGLKRTTPLRAKLKAWLDRVTPLRKKNPKRKAKLHDEQYGPPGFGDFVRARGCMVARQSGTTAGCLGPMQHCHRKSRATGGGWRNNSYCGCLGHHHEEHTKGQQTFERMYNLDLDLECLATTHQWEIRGR